MALLYFFILILLVSYLWFIGDLMGMVSRVRRHESFAGDPESTSITVLIPFRNESTNIPLLQECLEQQEIPPNWQVTVLWVDDHSQDGGGDIIRQKQSRWDHRVLSLPESKSGKKAALQQGLETAQSEWILTTDADALPASQWMQTMVEYARSHRWDFATGPVVLTGDCWPQRLQHWDMAAMMAITWLGWERGWWHLANGISLLVRTEAAKRTGGWGQEELASGDDLFMVKRLHALGFSGGFVAHRDAVVRTPGAPGWAALANQRKRWATKMRVLPERGLWLLGAFLLVVAWTPWLLIVAGILWKPVVAFAGVMLWAMKWLWDAWLLRLVGSEMDRPITLMESIWIQPLHACLLLVSAWYGVTGKDYVWKGRQVK